MDSPAAVRIETGSRLHLGLLDVSAPFGGLGVMVEDPKTIVELTRSDDFHVDRKIEPRALPIARRISDFGGRAELPRVSIKVVGQAPCHCGFGSGTQLSLAISEGIATISGDSIDSEPLAIGIADRGKRSAVGVHGYFHGGLIYEADESARPSPDSISLNPIRRRMELPSAWRLLVLVPGDAADKVFGHDERQQFAALKSDPASSNELRGLVESEVLPAAEASDFQRFADAIGRYNWQSGMLFADVQGGPYNGAAVTRLIQSLREAGATGVGQSSWGPGVFVWCQSEAAAESLATQFASGCDYAVITSVRNEGRRLTPISAGDVP